MEDGALKNRINSLSSNHHRCPSDNSGCQEKLFQETARRRRVPLGAIQFPLVRIHKRKRGLRLDIVQERGADLHPD